MLEKYTEEHDGPDMRLLNPVMLASNIQIGILEYETRWCIRAHRTYARGC